VLAVAAAAATAFSCRPEPGVGSVDLTRRGAVHVIDLSTCRDRVVRKSPSPARETATIVSLDGRWAANVRSSGLGANAKQTIWITDRRSRATHAVFSETQSYKTIGPGETPGPILLLGWSGDDRWVFFAIDPGGSGSIAADGLSLRVVSAAGGRARRIARMLVHRDYITWCGGRLVFTGGGDRVATNGKRLLVAGPPNWRLRPLVATPGRAWGSVACSTTGRWLVAQSQRQSDNANFFATRWALWRVSLDGSLERLTSPPRGYADESPRFSRDGRILAFVRSRNGIGRLYVLRAHRVVGPLLSLGFNPGFYGHHDWWQSADWSAAS